MGATASVSALRTRGAVGPAVLCGGAVGLQGRFALEFCFGCGSRARTCLLPCLCIHYCCLRSLTLGFKFCFAQFRCGTPRLFADALLTQLLLNLFGFEALALALQFYLLLTPLRFEPGTLTLEFSFGLGCAPQFTPLRTQIPGTGFDIHKFGPLAGFGERPHGLLQLDRVAL